MWSLIEFAPFIVGGLVSVLNFYLSFVRVPLCRWLGWDWRWVSGFPVIGSLLLAWFATLHLSSPGWFWTSVALAAVDTGGLHWFLAVVLWAEVARRR